MLATDPRSAAASWRPQLFGGRRAKAIADPIIEPLWTGPRILAFVEGRDIQLIDPQGEPVEGYDEITDALRDAVGDVTVLIEAYLTAEPIQTPAAIADRVAVPVPKAGQAFTQLMFGKRGNRRERLTNELDEARRRTVEGTGDVVAMVAVDLLWLDDESLCDVPLLERKRILESIVEESHLIRVGIHVRPPIDAWLSSWRSFGFRRLAYKAANSRYAPGQKNPDWATAEIPAR